MTDTGIYGAHLPRMEAVKDKLLAVIENTRRELTEKNSMDPAEHVLARIKSEKSMREKCRRQGLPETEESALREIHDAVGLRVVCVFLDEVYAMRDALVSADGVEIVQEKDYIRAAKPNGYRSYHMILRLDGYFAEIQLRTISMDTWAALEHHLTYKKGEPGALIREELKRCADELASTDVSMQTLRDMILSENEREG